MLVTATCLGEMRRMRLERLEEKRSENHAVDRNTGYSNTGLLHTTIILPYFLLITLVVVNTRIISCSGRCKRRSVRAVPIRAFAQPHAYYYYHHVTVFSTDSDEDCCYVIVLPLKSPSYAADYSPFTCMAVLIVCCPFVLILRCT